jgi:hypothetical protein
MITETRNQAAFGTRERMRIVYAGEYYCVNCPFCDDNRRRLWINHRYGQPNGRYRDTWLAHCYNEECLRNPDYRKQLEGWLIGFQNRAERDKVWQVFQGKEEIVELRPHDPPGYVVPIEQLPQTHQAVQYLIGRGFDIAELARLYKPVWCEVANSDYKEAVHRIIAPVYLRGVCVGFQGRLPFDAPKEYYANERPKYYTCPSMPRGMVVYNWDTARHYPFMVLNEGFTDVWSVGPWATCTFGASLSWRQMQMFMHEVRDKPIVFMWDPDKWDKMEGVIHDFEEAHTNPIVRVRLPDDTDPNDFQRDVLLRTIYTSAQQQGVNLPRIT